MGGFEPIAIKVIGLALPGVVDSIQGSLVQCVNLPFLQGVPIAKHLSAMAHLPVQLITDIEAATWGEYVCYGCQGRNAKLRFAHLRLGTGVGYAECWRGRFVKLPRLASGHLRLLVVVEGEGAKVCSCGTRGCLESYLSRRIWQGGRKRARVQIDTTDSNDGFPMRLAVGEADREALRVFNSALGKIRRALGSQGVLCVGGGLVDAWPALREGLRQSMRGDDPEGQLGTLIPALRGDNAGVIGAAMLAIRTEQGQ